MRPTRLPLASLPSFKGLFLASPLSLALLFNDDTALALARKCVGSASACATPCAAAAAAAAAADDDDGNDDASAALFVEAADGIASTADCKKKGNE
jgi:hypothetical protein